MARLELISVVDGTIIEGMLTDFKQFASVPDDTQDTMLLRILKNAALRVQEYADRAILPCKVRATLPVPESTGIVRLYMGGGTIESATNDRGDDVYYDPLPGGRLQLFGRGGTVVVTYTTVPNEGDQEALAQAVIRYATADYDGAETAELNQILSESVL